MPQHSVPHDRRVARPERKPRRIGRKSSRIEGGYCPFSALRSRIARVMRATRYAPNMRVYAVTLSCAAAPPPRALGSSMASTCTYARPLTEPTFRGNEQATRRINACDSLRCAEGRAVAQRRKRKGNQYNNL